MTTPQFTTTGLTAPITRRPATFPINETDCTVIAGGRAFTAGGACFDLDTGGTLYTGAIETGQRYSGNSGSLMTWHGQRVGTYWVTSTYRVRSQWHGSTVIRCITATVNGREYYGRQGDCDLIRLRPYRANAAATDTAAA